MNRATARRARASIAVPALLAGLIAPSVAGAATVVNAGFEKSATADRAFTSQNDPLPIGGWDFWDPQKLVAPVADPSSGQATVLGTWTPPRQAYPLGAPEGSAVGFVYVAGGPGGGELGLRQLTGLRLTAGTRYLLNVAVGNPRGDDARGFTVTGFPGYRIELRAGGEAAGEGDRPRQAGRRQLRRDRHRLHREGEGQGARRAARDTARQPQRARRRRGRLRPRPARDREGRRRRCRARHQQRQHGQRRGRRGRAERRRPQRRQQRRRGAALRRAERRQRADDDAVHPLQGRRRHRRVARSR